MGFHYMIVHLDLKGAPLRLQFLEKVFKWIKEWGASGVLIEWEDTFPYTGELAEIGSNQNASGDGMYSTEEVVQIFQYAKENNLEAIQLIQTIGHMEFVLKHPAFKGLQEKPKSPAVLCPSNPRSQELVRALVHQSLAVQPDAKYFHIGADEVWHTAICADCQIRASSSEHGTLCLYLEHIRDLALFIKQLRPDLSILMWDDMLRNISTDTLQFYKLGELVQPVVWDYNVTAHFHINPHMWNTYKVSFPAVWAGSAFKGANGSCKVYPIIDRYKSNQEAWINEIRTNSGINFAGVFLTGWSRYDHFATLCELLPTSMECLKHCLSMWSEKNNQTDVIESNEGLSINRNLHVPQNIMTYNSFDNSGLSVSVPFNQLIAVPHRLSECDMETDQEFPVQEIQNNTKLFEMLRERCYKLIHGDQVSTWMNPWQVEKGYTNPLHLEVVFVEATVLRRDLSLLKENFDRMLPTVTGNRSADEWVGTFVTPVLKKITELHDAVTKCINMDASVKPS